MSNLNLENLLTNIDCHIEAFYGTLSDFYEKRDSYADGTLFYTSDTEQIFIKTGYGWELLSNELPKDNNRKSNHRIRIINCKCCNAILPKTINYDDIIQCEYCGAVQNAYLENKCEDTI